MRVAPTIINVGGIIRSNTEETNLGKVKTEQIKHLGEELLTRFPKKFSTSFDENKRTVDEVTQGTTTRVRNKVAGYITRTMTLAQANSAMETDIEDIVE